MKGSINDSTLKIRATFMYASSQGSDVYVVLYLEVVEVPRQRQNQGRLASLNFLLCGLL